MSRLSSTLLVLAMNECENMKEIMPQIDRKWFDRILVVDGQSTDGTAEYSREMGYDVVVQTKRGPRNGLVEGFATITTDVVVPFSPDGNSPVEDIPKLLAKIEEGYDMVIASRYKGDAISYDDTFASKWANRIFTKSINVLFGGEYTDAMTMFRAMKTRLFYDLKLGEDESYLPEHWFNLGQGGLGYEPILSARAALAKLKIAEIPSDEPKRLRGDAKFPKIRGGLGYFAQLLIERAKPTPVTLPHHAFT